MPVHDLRNQPHSPILASRCKINSPGSNLTCLDGMYNLNLYIFISSARKLLILSPQFTPFKTIKYFNVYLLHVGEWLEMTKKDGQSLKKNFPKLFYKEKVTGQSGRVGLKSTCPP